MSGLKETNTVLDLNHKLLDNHRSFLSKHRGILEKRDASFLLRSEKAPFNLAVLASNIDDCEVFREFKTIYLMPWTEREAIEKDLCRYERKGGISYMVLEGDANTWPQRDGLRIESHRSKEHIHSFTEIQTKAFVEDLEQQEHWHNWLLGANLRNREDISQIFYIAHYKEKPVGTCLVVTTGHCLGIYAVGTLPENRKQGIATALMKRAIADAYAAGCDIISLQVHSATPAQRLYQSLGFRESFEASIYQRN